MCECEDFAELGLADESLRLEGRWRQSPVLVRQELDNESLNVEEEDVGLGV